MKKFLGNSFLKALAFVLAVLLTALGGLFAWMGISGAADDGVAERDFWKTDLCESYARQKLGWIADYVYWNDLSGLVKGNYTPSSMDFRCEIRDGNAVLFSTVEKNFVPVVSSYELSEVDESGHPTRDLTATGYLIRPIPVTSDLYPAFFAYENWHLLIDGAIVCGGLVLLLTLYLLCGAGLLSDGTVKVGGLHKIPYDLVAFGAFLAGGSLYSVLREIGHWRFRDSYCGWLWLFFTFGVFLAFAAVGFLFLETMAARMKQEGWWKNVVVVWIGRLLLWFFRALPTVWKPVLACGVFAAINVLLTATVFDWNSAFMLLVLITVDLAALLLAAALGTQLKTLEKGGEDIAKGDFSHGVDTRKLWGKLREHGRNLNSATGGLSRSVEEKMKSERFKTELITNVSHDLKTPLTSIVSYVDLLKKEEIESEKAKEYIDVLDRQSQKLKKLTEDLVEASKASSGALPVNKEAVDLVELVEQSVGEFSEKLTAADVAPVLDAPEELLVYTDGRLFWRVLDNLIQNIIKYAQPGTRAYFDLKKQGGRAVLQIKNISREPLNMSAETLMERFVRGDSSRNSDGNGLGLSIARSLTELCGGTFRLSLDGDLYKVMLTLPLWQEPLEPVTYPAVRSSEEETPEEAISTEEK